MVESIQVVENWTRDEIEGVEVDGNTAEQDQTADDDDRNQEFIDDSDCDQDFIDDYDEDEII
ncbi:hypothetical protein BVC80_8803g3 [Macleaya cordata]|uniref:Uncharacterized protein n=1 Tax=Macleaya cordata TaxID=56857 RepID=A0A200QEA3_MACCD|nr:hypothetical protein BVC80_8803g3 [Macleaya cordata]